MSSATNSAEPKSGQCNTWDHEWVDIGHGFLGCKATECSIVIPKNLRNYTSVYLEYNEKYHDWSGFICDGSLGHSGLNIYPHAYLNSKDVAYVLTSTRRGSRYNY